MNFKILMSLVIDGDDLSSYDDMGAKAEQERQDEDALDQLDWELASQDGRLTGKHTYVM